LEAKYFDFYFLSVRQNNSSELWNDFFLDSLPKSFNAFVDSDRVSKRFPWNSTKADLSESRFSTVSLMRKKAAMPDTPSTLTGASITPNSSFFGVPGAK